MAIIQIEDDIKDFVTSYADLAQYLDNCLINRDFCHHMTFDYLRQRFIASSFCTRYDGCNAVMWELKQKIEKCASWGDAWYEFSQSPIQAMKDCLEIMVEGKEAYRFDAKFETYPLTLVYCPNEIVILHFESPYLSSVKDLGLERFHQFQNNKDLFSVLYSDNTGDTLQTKYGIKNLCVCHFQNKPELEFQIALLFGVRDKNIIPCPYTKDVIKLLVKKC